METVSRLGEPTKAKVVERNYILGVGPLAHVKRCVALGSVEFVAGHRSFMDSLNAGDWVVWYAPREQKGAGEVIQSFVAIGQVVEGRTRKSKRAGEEVFARSLRYRKAARRVSVHGLLENLSFVKDPRYWGISFRATRRGLCREDFVLIAEAMGVRRIS